MASAVQKITLTSARDIPFNKLMLSKSNVRRTVAGVSIEELAEDIAQRTLLQSLSVRPQVDREDKETGMFEVQAGGRRYRALELLVKQKRMSKTQPVPCIVRTGGLAEEDSLAENVQRVPLSALEQFLAFKLLHEKGLGEEDIAARFFVSATVVKQRLKLASVSPRLIDVHASGSMSLEQLMAFTVSDDPARQEEVWDQLSRGHGAQPYQIRRQLTEGAVASTDRRAIFVGIEAYEKAGGVVTRDLFDEDGGGWLQDPALLDRLVIEKLKIEAEKVRAEGWKWITVAPDFSHGHAKGLRLLHGRIVELTENEIATCDALEAERDDLERKYAEVDDLPEDVERRIEEIETELEALNEQRVAHDPAEIAFAGAFVSVAYDGRLRIETGYVRPEDEPRTEPVKAAGQGGAEEAQRRPGSTDAASQRGVITVGTAGTSPPETEAEEEEDGIRPLSERLVSELTAFRTIALRDAVANNPHVALTVLLHKLCIDVFHQHAFENCLEATVREVSCPIQPADLGKSVPAKAVEGRHKAWLAELPRTDTGLWKWLDALSSTRRLELLAHCVSFGVNALYDKNDRSGPYGVKRRIAHADRLARAVGLDPVQAGWSPTVDNYLGRVPKARILEALREAKGDASTKLIEYLKKPDMAKEAERLLANTGWLPEPLRTPDAQAGEAECESDADDLPDFLDDEHEEESQEFAAE